MKFTDTHTHSNFSPDGEMSMEAAAKRALANNLQGITFTDHLDMLISDDNDGFLFDPAEAAGVMEKVAVNYPGIGIYSGIEAGLQPHSVDAVKEFVSKYDFDCIIASIHFLDGMDPYTGDYYIGKNSTKAYGRYLEVMSECIVRFGNFDILGHYDYIGRYAPYANKSVRYCDFPDYFDAILTYLALNGKALEINSRTYRRNTDSPQLDINVLKRYRELGGEFVSLGSDAHTVERIGEQFEYYSEVLKSCGFKYITHYEKRKHVVVKI